MIETRAPIAKRGQRRRQSNGIDIIASFRFFAEMDTESERRNCDDVNFFVSLFSLIPRGYFS